MSKTDFASLPDDARLWIFPASRALDGGDASTLLDRVDAFLDQWHAHGHPVVGARELRHGRFLFVAADERATGVSGCSIDSMTQTLKAIERELAVRLLDHGPVWYRGRDGAVRSAPRPEFRQMARSGAVDGDTLVFDNTASTVGALRRGEWERPLRESWHAKAFGVEEAAAR